ncbi:homeobox protein knotted-1-like 1 [Papaver somniferum]|uniref:homeobox protein knotted-1-like 1 n=1 Tax=Papaver somniferum TaxID=3469 RepID=UPI000E70332B|nr:homeobox protein knotted-1-like 1 [Papaver somniferum]
MVAVELWDLYLAEKGETGVDEDFRGFRSRIEDVREEILRKRRAGKLPGDTTSVLKNWWKQHAKWPYPTEDDKAKLVEEIGLQLKQINNWFINQRKRNWHSNSQSITSLKSKRKRYTIEETLIIKKKEEETYLHYKR